MLPSQDLFREKKCGTSGTNCTVLQLQQAIDTLPAHKDTKVRCRSTPHNEQLRTRLVSFFVVPPKNTPLKEKPKNR
jgi:hypothetical protein